MTDSYAPSRQAQRAASTRRRMLQATIDALSEVGYSATTLREIASRAGSSQGGIFRHFDSRLDVIVAAVELIHERQLDTLRSVAADHRLFEADWLSDLRQAARSPDAIAWYEVLVAARHDEDLSRRMYELITAQTDEIVRFSANIPTFALVDETARATWVRIALRTLQGGALVEWGQPSEPPRHPSGRGLIGLFLLLAGNRSGTR